MRRMEFIPLELMSPANWIYDPSGRIKFTLFQDINLMVIEDMQTGSATLFDPETNKVNGYICTSSDKNQKHFKSFVYDLLHQIYFEFNNKRRFIQALFILDPNPYTKTKYELYDYIILVFDKLCQELSMDPEADMEYISDLLAFVMLVNDEVDRHHKIYGMHKCDYYNQLEPNMGGEV